MSRDRKSFTEQEIQMLEKNPNVLRVMGKNISYSPLFKVAAVQAYREGQTPMEIFLQAGFYIEMIGRDMPKKCLHRWRKVYATFGEAGLIEERKGKSSTSRKSEGDLNISVLINIFFTSPSLIHKLNFCPFFTIKNTPLRFHRINQGLNPMSILRGALLADDCGLGAYSYLPVYLFCACFVR